MSITYIVSCDNEGCETKQEIEALGDLSPEYMAEAYGWRKIGKNKHLCGPCKEGEVSTDDGKV